MSDASEDNSEALGFETTLRGHVAPTEDAHTLPSLTPGQLLLGRYHLDRPVSVGGMGMVWRATDTKLSAKVAVKFTTRLDEVGLKRFRDESLLAASLGSPHILRVFDVGEHEGLPFSVTEWLEGETLSEMLLGSIRLSPQTTISIMTQLGRALEAVHTAGIVHRDLKPSNIFLVENGDGFLAKLLDFGVARHKSSELTKKGDAVGTPEYMSPEQASDARLVDGRSDLWALSVVCFECLTGRRPFEGRNWAQILRKMAGGEYSRPSDLAELPPAFDRWFDRAVSPKIDDRFQTIDDCISALTVALTAGNLGERASADRVSQHSDDRALSTQGRGKVAANLVEFRSEPGAEQVLHESPLLPKPKWSVLHWSTLFAVIVLALLLML